MTLVLRDYNYGEYRSGKKLEVWKGNKLICQHYSSMGLMGLKYHIRNYTALGGVLTEAECELVKL